MADETKLEKLKRLRELGIDPYPYSYGQLQHAGDITDNFEKFEGKQASVAGRVMRFRGMGKLFFFDILDGSGKIQVLARSGTAPDKAIDVLKLTDIGDILGIKGKVIKSERGEKSIEASEITMLSKSLRFLPEKFHGLSDTEVRYRKRYLDLIMNPDARSIFRTRAKAIRYIRDFLDAKGYLEVETPILQPVYGGANAKPFITHHNALDTDLYLRIADELYLKRLIVGGLEKVYEFCKDFRNEDIDATHNPEFTMLEFYEAYGDYNTYMILTEEMLSGLVKHLFNSGEITYQGQKVSFKAPFKRIHFVEEIRKRSGIDIADIDDKEAAKIAEKEGLKVAVKSNYHVADALFDKYVLGTIKDPTFAVDYPSYMCPLTKDSRKDKRLSERFELFVCGKELVNVYSELTDPVEQRRKFEAQALEKKKGDEEMPPIDEDFLEAIEYGMPPTAGFGMGIDRLVMLLTDKVSIKEVLLFPSVRPESKKTERRKA
ncbi:MAG: lysine--tRNA ligase [Candidatus Micrarchaeota archaeon]|nr:lysine--tRNA ligase [Candidatus Micrarchaeota archaeon]MDE1824290.1 lysine--tRNA ligase [Candidatus Micrarchaeota archaeon]MDE1849763.1 lysine--tRNA ligase [Candidatus Micrarchaeota archaeon]